VGRCKRASADPTSRVPGAEGPAGAPCPGEGVGPRRPPTRLTWLLREATASASPSGTRGGASPSAVPETTSRSAPERATTASSSPRAASMVAGRGPWVSPPCQRPRPCCRRGPLPPPPQRHASVDRVGPRSGPSPLSPRSQAPTGGLSGGTPLYCLTFIVSDTPIVSNRAFPFLLCAGQSSPSRVPRSWKSASTSEGPLDFLDPILPVAAPLLAKRALGWLGRTREEEESGPLLDSRSFRASRGPSARQQ